jgi:hypothetical protein
MTHCSLDSLHLIWRTEIEAYYSDAEYRVICSGLVNPHVRRLKAMLKA